MCTAIEEMIQDSREEGIAYGVEQGEQIDQDFTGRVQTG